MAIRRRRWVEVENEEENDDDDDDDDDNATRIHGFILIYCSSLG